MDRTDVTPDPDDLLETALTDPESFDAARTARLVAQLEHDDARVQRAASWALRFVLAERPSLVDTCTGRFRRALRDPAAQPVVLRTLAVLAEHNHEAVAEIVDETVEAEMIDTFAGKQIIAGYQLPELESDGSVIADDGDETTPPTEIAAVEARTEPDEPESDDDSPATPRHPPDTPPTKPPRLDRSLTAYESEAPAGQYSDSATESVEFTESGRELTATCRRTDSTSPIDETVFYTAVDRWRRIDDHDAVARVVDFGTHPVPWLISEQGAPGSVVERTTPVSTAEARWVLSQLADAVHYAHTAGVLHGGIWPGSITLVNAVDDPTAWAFPRLGGWGLWEVSGPPAELYDMPRSYAAPEHIAPDRFGGVNVATDIYGLGAIGYELLTGTAPVREDGTVRSAQDVGTRVPDGLSTVLAKSLKTAKMERYASAVAFKRDVAAESRDE